MHKFIHLIFAGVDLVKPATIYYNASDILKGLPAAGKEEAALNQKGRSKRGSSSSEERVTPSTPSAPAPAVRSKPAQRSLSVAGAAHAQQDSASLNLIETARVAALEDRLKVSVYKSTVHACNYYHIVTFSAQVLFMPFMQVKHWSHKFLSRYNIIIL